MCTSNRDDRKLENTVKQSRFKHLGELHKEWTEAGVSESRVTTLRHLQEKSYQDTSEQKHRQKHLSWAKEKKNWTVAQWSKVLFSDESKFSISFGNQGPRVWRKNGEAQNPSCLKSSGKFLKSEIIWGAVTSSGVGPLYFIKFWSTLCFHLLTSFIEMLVSFSSRNLAPAHNCQNHFQVVCWPWYYCAWLASQHAWPNSHMEYMGYFQEKDEKQWIQQYRRDEVSIVPQQCHRLIASMPHLTDARTCSKGSPTKSWVQKWTYFKEL